MTISDLSITTLKSLVYFMFAYFVYQMNVISKYIFNIVVILITIPIIISFIEIILEKNK